MTKAVRIENADTSDYKVRVRFFEKGLNGEPDTLVDTQMLSYPSAMTSQHSFITSTRYAIVDEHSG